MSDTTAAAAAEPQEEEYEFDDWELYTTPHGFEEGGCYWCPRPDTCDCPCATCIQGRRDYGKRLSEYEASPYDEAAAEEDDYEPLCLECGGYMACNCGNDAEPDYGDWDDDEEDYQYRCRGCGSTMDGDEGWGLTLCSRGCYHKVYSGEC